MLNFQGGANRVDTSGELTIEEDLAGKVCNNTQFGRTMKELGITMIPARSAQLKVGLSGSGDTPIQTTIF